MSTLRLDRLRLQNFRCFAACDIDLHPQLTVLVAENGRGKTAILDGIATALGPIVDELSAVHQWTGVEAKDVRLVRGDDGEMLAVLPTELEAHGLVDGERLTWAMALNGVGKRARTSSKDLQSVRVGARCIRERLDGYAHRAREMAPPLPLVAFYGTGRLWADQRLTEKRRRRDVTPLGRLGGYQDCLSSASSFKAFAAWYEDMSESVRGNTGIAAHPDENPVKLLSAVRKAVHQVLKPTGWVALDWQFAVKDEYGQVAAPGYLFVEHAEAGRIPVSRLSDGVRNMVALVADIAHRCARLNPQFGEEAAQRTPGVLLIDEIDMHLHPRWQQEVAGLLRQAFPAMQIVLTTHSPQVLTTVDASSIRVLEVDEGKGELETPQVQTMGVQSQDVLARIMRVNPTPDVDAARKLSRYKALIQQGLGGGSEATGLRGELDTHFGARHAVILECDRLAKLESLKPRRSPAGGT